MRSNPSTGTLTIHVPANVGLQELALWNDSLWRSSHAQDINLDFQDASFFTPFAMLFICHQVLSFHEMFPNTTIHIANPEHLDWPRRMNLFACLDGTLRPSD